MDYSMNIQVVISLFYIGIGGLDIELINSAQGIEGGGNWEENFIHHSPIVCKAILEVVYRTITDSLKEEIALTISEKLREKIIILTQKILQVKKELARSTNESLPLLTWEHRKETWHTYDSNSDHVYYI